MPPVALSEMLCGVFVALSSSVSVPLNAPEVLGRKATEMVQDAPGANAAGATGQVVAVWIKLELSLIEEIVSGIAFAALVFVTVITFAPDVSPMSTLCQEREVGDKLAVGNTLNDTPHPVSARTRLRRRKVYPMTQERRRVTLVGQLKWWDCLASKP